MRKKLVYICSPCRGDIEKNIEKAQRYCRDAVELWGDEVDSIRSFDAESQRSIQQMDEVTIYPAAELILTKKDIEEGILCLEADEKKQEKAFRDQKKPEEAQRFRRAVGELVESLKEGFDVQTLDAYIRYFCRDTVSFLDFMKEVGAKVTLVSSGTAR